MKMKKNIQKIKNIKRKYQKIYVIILKILTKLQVRNWNYQMQLINLKHYQQIYKNINCSLNNFYLSMNNFYLFLNTHYICYLFTTKQAIMFVTKYLISKNIMYITRIIVLHLMIFNQLLYCSFMYILIFISVSLVHYTAIIYLKKLFYVKA